MSKNEASLKCRMPHVLWRVPSWNWKDLMGIVAVVIFAYQLNQVTSLESRLVIQEAKFEKLEQVYIKHKLSIIPSVENNPENKKDVPDVTDESKKDVPDVTDEDSKKIEYKPHSHYAIETKDGVPVNPDVEYTLADFEHIFHVIPIQGIEETAEATKLLSQNIVWDEKEYHNNFYYIAPLAGKVADFFEKLPNRHENKMYVKWESKETGFGLYTKEPIKKGDIVDLYAGILDADWEYFGENKDTDYMWVYPSETGNFTHGVSFGVDGRKKGNYLRFANHAGEKSNTKAFFLPYNNRWNVFYVAVKDIAAGEAITSDYGSEYFEDRSLL